MSMHFLDRQRLQNFLGLYKKGGVERAEVLHKIVRLLEPMDSGSLAEALPVFETTFQRCFIHFHSSDNPQTNQQLAAATAVLRKTFAKLKSNDRRIWESVAEYLLTILPRHKNQETPDKTSSLQSAAHV